MPRHIGKAAVVALAALLLSLQAVVALGVIGGPSGVTRSAIDPAVNADRMLHAVALQVDRAETVISTARQRIAKLDARIATLEAEIRTASADRVADQRRLVKRTEAATEQIVGWRLPKAPTVLQLSEPLEVVASALHEGDEHRSALLTRIGDLALRAAEIDALRTEATAIAFELGGVRAELSTDDALAARTGWVGVDGAEDVTTHIRALAGRVDSATLQLRQDTARILTLSTGLTAERTAIREDLQGARQAESDLVSSLVSAESPIRAAVVSMLGDSAWGPFGEGVLEVCPVDMPNAYWDDWLAPRYGGGFHLHQGIDIMAAEGTPIRAPFPGEAVAVPNTLGGLAVKVYGAEGYVYNAHLSAYGKLGPVETGDIIGYVGSTGDASGPHDHFEWHPGGGEAVNPFELLNAACRPA